PHPHARRLIATILRQRASTYHPARPGVAAIGQSCSIARGLHCDDSQILDRVADASNNCHPCDMASRISMQCSRGTLNQEEAARQIRVREWNDKAAVANK